MDNQDIAIRTALDEYVAGLELPEYAVPFVASPDFPVIKYHKGVNVVSGFKPTKYTGWHIAIEQSAELDNLFASMGIPVVRVKHLGGDEVNYWQLNTIDGYILCRSVPPIKGYGPDVWQSTGVPYVWNDCKDTYMYGSQLQVLFFLKGLLDLGYTQPLILTLSRTVTEHFVQKVLRRQEAFLEAVKRAFRKSGKVANLAFYAYWMTIAKDEEETTTKGGGSYYSPAMVIAPPLTIEYVREHQALSAHLEVIESFIPQWDTWAQAASQRLLEPPRDNAVESSEEATGEASDKVTPITKDATVKAANDALYKAAMKARQKAFDAQLCKNDRDWVALLETAGITEFTKPDDIRVINDLIKELMSNKAS
jgi:hypothetical protein